MIEIDFFNEKDSDALFLLFSDWSEDYKFDFEVFSHSLNKVNSDDNNKIIIAKENNNIVGYAQITLTYHLGFEPYYEVIQILTAKNKRNKGIGKMIMRKIENIVSKEKINIVKLHSQVFRTKAHMFYENLGYEYEKISKFYKKKL